jgi:ketosteroid isomerase-like protein
MMRRGETCVKLPADMRLSTRLAKIAIVALASLQACAPMPNTQRSDPSAIVATLTSQADAWDKAIVRKDRRAIEENMAEDFRQIDGAGNVETKASFVTDIVSADLRIDPYTVEDFDVRLYGDVALLCGRTRMTGTYQGKPFTSHYRYIDIYVKRDGAWKIVSVQISRIPN